MNKKVALSVLSTAVVASMAASAYAAPKAGVYVGGDIKKYYSTTTLLNLSKEAKEQYGKELRAAGNSNLVFVHINGKGAFFSEILKDGSAVAFAEPLKKSDFVDLYKVVKPDGTSTETEDAKAKVDGDDNTGDLKVESVSAINASQIQVKFSADVEDNSAVEAKNYTVKKGSTTIVAIPSLVDSKTVVLTIDPKVAVDINLNQATLDITASEIKSAKDASKKIPNYSGKVTVLDLNIPQAVDAKLVGPGLIQVSFSEPVYSPNGLGFLIDGGQYSVSVKEFTPATKSVLLQTGTLSQGNHTITVNPDNAKEVKDGAGLLVAKTDVALSVTEDKTAPALVSGKVSSQTEVVLTFDEPITGLAKTSVYHTANTSAYQPEVVEEVKGTNQKQWKLTFKNPLPTGNLTLYVAKDAIQDNFGNKNSQVLSTTVSVVSDTVKPTVTELKVVSATDVTLTFSEEVTGADSKANYKITDKDGKLVSGYNIKYLDKKATIMFNPALKEGVTYNVEVTGVKDKAVVPNDMDRYTSSFTVADLGAPTVTKNGLYDKVNHKVTVFFSEPMNGSDLLDKSKYTLVAGSTQVALPTDATVAVGPNSTSATITLPAVVKDRNDVDISDKIDGLIVGQMRDVAGNKTAQVFTEVSLTAAAGKITEAVADSGVTVDTRTVQFAINKPLKTIDAKDFTVGGEVVEFAKYENKTLKDGKTYGAVITLQVAADKKWNTDATPAIKTTGEPKSESQYGDKFAADTTLVSKVADAVAPALADANKDGKADFTLNFNDKGNVASVTVSFTEALKQSTLSVEDFEVPGYTVSDVKLVEKTKAEVVLSPAAERGTSFKVRVVGNISDEFDNVFVGNGAELTIGTEHYDADDAAKALKAAQEAVTALETAVGKDLKVEANLIAAEKSLKDAEAAVAKVVTGADKVTLEGKVTAAKKTVTEARAAFDNGAADVLKSAQEAVAALETAAGKDLKVEANLTAAETALADAKTKVAKVANGADKTALEGKVTAAEKTVTEARKNFDDAKALEASKTALNDAIKTAQEKYDSAKEGTASGEYPAAAKSTFKGFIESATNIHDDAASTKAKVDQAITDLKDAQKTFEASVIA